MPSAPASWSIDGNETAGHEIVHILRHRYRHARGVNLWVVKTVNPDGVAANTRKNAHGVDLNRNFSYQWRGGVPPSSGYYPGPHPFSEPESRAVRRLVKRIRPNVTIWYHQPWGRGCSCPAMARPGSRSATRASPGSPSNGAAAPTCPGRP